MAWPDTRRKNLALLLLLKRLRRKRKRTVYVRELLNSRRTYGEYHHLVQELQCSDPEYHFKYFRMTKASFDVLLSYVNDKLVHAPTHRSPISPAERLAITLRCLASPGTLQHVAMSYRMHKSTLSGILRETLPAIWDCLSPVFLKLPSPEVWEKIRSAFEEKWNFPNVIGAIDGKHFSIQCPAGGGSDFHNYKGFNSLILLAVADADYRFVLVDIGAEGRQSDGGVFKNSLISKGLEEGTLGIPSGRKWPLCLVGDAAFPLQTYLMRPFPGKGLDERKRIFNYRLSRARRTVENAFGILVARWRVFLTPMSGRLQLCEDMIKAAVCLHNFLMADKSYCPSNYADSVQDGRVVNGAWRSELESVGSNQKFASNRSSSTAMAIREELADFFVSPAGRLPWQSKVVSRQ